MVFSRCRARAGFILITIQPRKVILVSNPTLSAIRGHTELVPMKFGGIVTSIDAIRHSLDEKRI